MKQKTHRSAAKRFKITRTGKVMHRKATGNHMLTKKSGGQRRRIEGMTTSEGRDAKNVKRLLGKG